MVYLQLLSHWNKIITDEHTEREIARLLRLLGAGDGFDALTRILVLKTKVGCPRVF